MANPTTSFGYTDSVSTEKNISVPDLSYSADFAEDDKTAKRSSSSASSELIITNLTSPTDQPETIRWGYESIADIYRNTGIDPSFMSVSKRGASLVGQVNDLLRVTPADDSGCCSMQQIMLPIEAHWVLKFPISQYVTPEIALQVLERAFATAYATGKTDASKLGALMRRSLVI